MNHNIRFNKWARRYDRSILQLLVFNQAHIMLLKQIRLKYFHAKQPVRILDVACGTGRFIACLRKLMPDSVELYGIDYSEKMIEKAKTKAGYVSWNVANINELPYKENTFDIITCSHAFHHFPSQTKALAEIYRVLKPGGILMIVDGYRDNLLGQIIYGIVTFIEKNVYHVPQKEMKEMFLKVGFKNTKQIRFHYIPLLFTSGEK